jgi:hypothetical protein
MQTMQTRWWFFIVGHHLSINKYFTIHLFFPNLKQTEMKTFFDNKLVQNQASGMHSLHTLYLLKLTHMCSPHATNNCMKEREKLLDTLTFFFQIF